MVARIMRDDKHGTEELWLTTEEAASLLKVHPETVRRMVREGELEHRRVKSLIRIPRRAVMPKVGELEG